MGIGYLIVDSAWKKHVLCVSLGVPLDSIPPPLSSLADDVLVKREGEILRWHFSDEVVVVHNLSAKLYAQSGEDEQGDEDAKVSFHRLLSLLETAVLSLGHQSIPMIAQKGAGSNPDPFA